MHLLFVTSLVPDGEPATGYEIANAAIIAALRRAGVRVTVMGFIWPGKKPAEPEHTILLGEVDVRTETAASAQKAAWLAKAVATGLTFSSAKLRVVSEDRLRAAIRSAGPVDAYVLNAVPLAGAFERAFEDKPSIFVAHNVEHRSASENADAARGAVERILYGRESRLLKRLEERLCARAAFVFTLADDDCRDLGLHATGRCAALPLVTRAPASERSEAYGRGEEPAPASERSEAYGRGGETAPASGRSEAYGREFEYDAALIGTWTWQPNRIGLEWFLDEVVPRLDPDIRIAVAGAIPADLGSPASNVAFVGRVPDAGTFIASAAVVPLVSRAGTGVQLKTIETFELGLPSVATSRSVRGIATIPANCAVVDDAAGFAAALADTVARVRWGEDLRLDGAAFHAAQLAELDRKVAIGLHHLTMALNPKSEKIA